MNFIGIVLLLPLDLTMENKTSESKYGKKRESKEIIKVEVNFLTTIT